MCEEINLSGGETGVSPMEASCYAHISCRSHLCSYVLNIQGTASICHKNPFVLLQLGVILQPRLQSRRENLNLIFK